MDKEKPAYWRHKSDRDWHEATIQRLGNGLVRITSMVFWTVKPTILSEDEIEIKWMTNDGVGK